MTAKSETPTKTARDLWRRNGLIWAALMVLLALTLSFAYVPLGAANTPIALGIGATKAGLVVWLFMELAKSSALKRLAAATGLLWLCVMFTLTLADVLARLHTH
jgi:cytochrome c oxidase subunit 4